MSETARVSGYLEIPGMCIPGTATPDPMPFDHAEWFDWYNRTLVHRILVRQAVNQPGDTGRQAQRAQRILCQQPYGIGHIYWLCTFCSIVEPRAEGDDNDPVVRPFIPYPRQIELILAIHDTMTTKSPSPQASLACEKAREVGATWIDSSHHAWEWTFGGFYTGLLVARLEDDVDKADDPSSWMWKIDFILGRHMRLLGNDYPQFLLPQGFTWEKAVGKLRTKLSLTNPETSGNILGLATTSNAGRQRRVKKLSMDEAAFNEYCGEIFNLNAFTTNHRFLYSSAGTDPPDFMNIVQGKEGYKKPRVFRFTWDQVPGRDREWLEAKRNEMSEDAFQREVMLDYLAGTGTNVYPEAQILKPGWWPYEPGLGPLYVAIDDGYDDDTGITIFQRESGTQWVRLVASYRNQGKIIHFYGSILKGVPENRFARDYSKYDLAFLKWCAHIGLVKLATFVGDRHGDQDNQVTGTNPFQELYEEYGIFVLTAQMPEDNSFDTRKKETKQLIPWLRVHEQMNAPDALEALQQYRYPKRRSTSQATGENKKPVHSGWSHLATSVERFAVQFPVGQVERHGKSNALPRNTLAQSRDEKSLGRFGNRPVILGSLSG